MRTEFILAGLIVTLAGCSFSPIGENTFNCNRKENPSDYCRSFKSLDKSTDAALPESRFDKEFRMSDYDRATGIAPDGRQEKTEQSNGQVKFDLPHIATATSTAGDDVDAVKGGPVRRSPIIQRVLIKKFVDENDMLQEDVIVYKEVAGSKWAGFDQTKSSNLSGGAVYPHRPTANAATPVSQSAPQQEPVNNFSQPESTESSTARSPAASGPSMPE